MPESIPTWDEAVAADAAQQTNAPTWEEASTAQNNENVEAKKRFKFLDIPTLSDNELDAHSETYLPPLDPKGKVYLNGDFKSKERAEAIQKVIVADEKEAKISEFIENNLLLSNRNEAELKQRALTDIINLVPSEFGDWTKGITGIASRTLSIPKLLEAQMDQGIGNKVELGIRNFVYDTLFDTVEVGDEEFYVAFGRPIAKKGTIETDARLSPVLQPAVEALESVREKTPSGFDKYPQSIEHYLKKGEYGMAGGRWWHSVQEQTPQTVYQVLAATMGLSGVTLPAMGMEAAAGKYAEIEKLDHLTQEQKLANATITGASEVVSETVTFGWMNRIFKGQTRATTKLTVRGIMSSLLPFIEEPAGEDLNQIIENVTDRVMNIKDVNGKLPTWDSNLIDTTATSIGTPGASVAFDIRSKIVADEVLQNDPMMKFKQDLSNTLKETGTNKSVVDMNDNYLRNYMEETEVQLQQKQEAGKITAQEMKQKNIIENYPDKLDAIPELQKEREGQIANIYRQEMLEGAKEDAAVGQAVSEEINAIVNVDEKATAEEVNEIADSFSESEINEDGFGLRHTDIENLRETMKMESLNKGEKIAMQHYVNNAKATQVHKKAESIAAEVLANPDSRVVTGTEHVGMVMKVMELQQQMVEAENNFKQARKAKNKNGVGIYSQQMADIRAKVDIITQATFHGSSLAGRLLQIRKIMLNQMTYDIAGIKKKAAETKDAPLSWKEKKLLKKHAREIEALNTKIEKLEKQAAIAQKQSNQQNAEDYTDEMAEKSRKSKAKKSSDKIKKKREDGFSEISNFYKVLNEGFTLPLRLAEGISSVAESYVQEGITKLPDIIKKIQERAPELTSEIITEGLAHKKKRTSKENIQDAKAIFRDLKEQARLIVDINKELAGYDTSAPVGESTASDETLDLRKQKAEIRKNKRDIAALPLKEQKAREVAIKKEQRAKEAAVRKAQKAREAVIRKNQKIQEKVQKKLFDLKNRYAATQPNRQKTMRFARWADAIEQAVAEGKIERARTSLAKLAKEVKLFEKIETHRKALELNDPEAMLDLVSPKRRKEAIEQNLSFAELELFHARRAVRSKIAELAPTTLLSAWASTSGAMQALTLSADLGYVTRQGKMTIASHPVMAKEAFKKATKIQLTSLKLSEKTAEGESMWQRIKDPNKQAELIFDEMLKDLYDSPLGKKVQKHKLAITDPHMGMTQHEEKFAKANGVEKIPFYGSHVLRGSELAHTAGLNMLRLQLFENFMRNNPDASNDVLDSYAAYVNMTTGRGSLILGGEKIASELAQIFLAPRWIASNFGVLTAPFNKKYMKHKEVRHQIYRDYGAFMTTRLGILALAAAGGAEVEYKDPLNPDFLKVKINNTRIDPWGGAIQPARMLAGVAFTVFDGNFNQKINTTQKSLQLGSRYFLYKTNPLVNFLWAMSTGENVIGQDQGRLETISRHLTPLTAQLVAQLAIDASQSPMQRSEVLTRSLTLPVEFYGTGVSTYEDNSKVDSSEY